MLNAFRVRSKDAVILDCNLACLIDERNDAVDELAEFYKNDDCCQATVGYCLRDKIDLLKLQICEMKIKRLLLFIRGGCVSDTIFFVVVWIIALIALFLITRCSEYKIEDMPESYYAASAISSLTQKQRQQIIDIENCDKGFGIEQSQCKKRQYPNYSH